MTLTQAALADALKDRPFQFYPSITSTNDAAVAWARTGAPQGAVVIADEQTQGRGRMGRVWYTPPNVALAVSVVLTPPSAFATRVGLLGALAVAELCEGLGIGGVGIKWPNDVQIDGLKVCGVLPEAVWEGTTLLAVVLGMGINVRVVLEGELARTATNLEAHAVAPLDRTQLIAALLARVDAWAKRISEDALIAAWRSRLTTLGKRVESEGIAGVAIDVLSDGALLIVTDDGRHERLVAGDIHLTG